MPPTPSLLTILGAPESPLILVFWLPDSCVLCLWTPLLPVFRVLDPPSSHAAQTSREFLQSLHRGRHASL